MLKMKMNGSKTDILEFVNSPDLKIKNAYFSAFRYRCCRYRWTVSRIPTVVAAGSFDIDEKQAFFR